MLSYIELVNRFWRIDEQYNFSGNETRLYFYLLKVANQLGWPEEFEYADDKLAGNVGLKVNTLKPRRDRLIEAGLVDFIPGGKGRGSKVRYQVRYQKLTPKESERYQERHQKLIPNEAERCQERDQKLTPNADKVSEKVSSKVSKIDTYSIYKRLKTFFKLSLASERKKIAGFLNAKKRVRKAPFVSRVPPKPPLPARLRTDPFLFRSESEKVNVPFSDWYKLYQYNWAEDQCRRVWLDLTEEERIKAKDHTPDYVKSTPVKRFRLLPAKYLEEKGFNNEIIDRNENHSKSESNASESGGREVIRTEYTPQKFGRRGGNGQRAA